MKIHQLKILPEHFDPVFQGIKTSEVRYNDRQFQVGDVLELKEWIPDRFTGSKLWRTVLHVADLNDFKEGYVLLSMRPSFSYEIRTTD
ncbi:DUF3850 domain-containing protein [Budviciaceae bacterium CWB-B4]|uniref:DUF3850 domain-containing protein n=1 Tax=Limnobaculum xujianqingii TaxID=2738837 RepID=A0A9D7AKT5_9GAMM|nr:DUF3850 domain-containing protein [Limnobaculum xujianqingii]MBK5074409.1 DUF3850 domain-containing protein [Limnobaculum xujianqingii]MBK5177925.1 DUF3850 domain-containing protein [Limnobaculum xujianqingii]